MRVMILDAPGHPLRLTDLPLPTPRPEQVLIQVQACGVQRTDVHVLDGMRGTHQGLEIIFDEVYQQDITRISKNTESS